MSHLLLLESRYDQNRDQFLESTGQQDSIDAVPYCVIDNYKYSIILNLRMITNLGWPKNMSCGLTVNKYALCEYGQGFKYVQGSFKNFSISGIKSGVFSFPSIGGISNNERISFVSP